jgi:hypothetical protein
VKPGGGRNRSSGPAVPLSRMQTDILRLLAAHRDPESDVAGASPLNRDAPRISGDIDDFHDRQERVAAGEAGEVVQPDPDRLDGYQTHAGQQRGQWPSSPEISSAMFERYNKKPSP